MSSEQSYDNERFYKIGSRMQGEWLSGFWKVDKWGLRVLWQKDSFIWRFNMIMWSRFISGIAVCVALLTSVCGAQTTPACPLAGKTVTLNFDATPLSAGVELDATAYLNSFGITLSAVTSGSSVLIIGQGFPGIPLSTSGPNYFNQFNGNHPETLTMNFCAPLSSISFSRTGMTADSKPAWTAEALNAQGTVLDSVGEPLTATGVPIGPQHFTLSGSGIVALRINSDNGAFTNLSGVPIDDLTLAGGCQVEVPPPFGLDSQLPWSQGNPLWASEEYDDVVPNTTIGQEGCALTALALEVQSAGVFTTPLFLNDDLRMFNGYGPNGKIDWGLATRAVNQRGFNLKWKNVAKQDLDDALCIGKHPVIAAVRGSHGTPSGHFVIITGKQGDTYTIIDPGCSACATLASTNTCSTTTGGTLCNYGNQFDTRGFVVDPAGNISELDFSLGDVADFLITDPIGRSTGLDPSKGNVQVIPASAHYVDSLDNDVTGEADLKPDHFVNIFQPQSGNYSVFVSGTKLGEYVLGINAFSEDGTRQPSVSASGIANFGSSSKYEVQFSSSPGTISNLTRVATFQSTLDDINNGLQLGLIDNSGIANSLSKKIQHASNTVEPERTNTMNAFVNEVNAQSGKHITGIAVQVLLEDANSLLKPSTQ